MSLWRELKETPVKGVERDKPVEKVERDNLNDEQLLV